MSPACACTATITLVRSAGLTSFASGHTTPRVVHPTHGIYCTSSSNTTHGIQFPSLLYTRLATNAPRRYKDVFWTTHKQPGYPSDYGTGVSEPFSELEAVVSVYTAGPVSAGDGFGFTNNSLLAMTCTAAGTLLKPSWPAVPIDEYHLQRATGNGGPDGEFNYAPSVVPSPQGGCADGTQRWVGFYSMDLKAAYNVNISRIFDSALCRGRPEQFVYRTPLTATATVQLVSGARTVTLAACGKADYHLFTVTTAGSPNALTLLGEVGKDVAVSPVRFTEIQASTAKGQARLQVSVAGDVDETVTIMYAKPTSVGAASVAVGIASCTIDATGTCTIHATEML